MEERGGWRREIIGGEGASLRLVEGSYAMHSLEQKVLAYVF